MQLNCSGPSALRSAPAEHVRVGAPGGASIGADAPLLLDDVWALDRCGYAHRTLAAQAFKRIDFTDFVNQPRTCRRGASSVSRI